MSQSSKCYLWLQFACKQRSIDCELSVVNNLSSFILMIFHGEAVYTYAKNEEEKWSTSLMFSWIWYFILHILWKLSLHSVVSVHIYLEVYCNCDSFCLLRLHCWNQVHLCWNIQLVAPFPVCMSTHVGHEQVFPWYRESHLMLCYCDIFACQHSSRLQVIWEWSKIIMVSVVMKIRLAEWNYRCVYLRLTAPKEWGCLSLMLMYGKQNLSNTGI